MSRVSPSNENKGPIQAKLKQKGEADLFRQVAPAETDRVLADDDALLTQVSQLPAKAKSVLVRKLITQLETSQIQAILEFGLHEIGDRDRQGISSPAVSHNTRLVLKKDYSYQERGLSEPTQYYVYLRRRKPKLDRYIGALFYIPVGCTLSYFLDAKERLIFNPPHNIFQLRDSTDSSMTQLVRLICLEPPAADYTFSKQQNDTPEICLSLEYLDSKTYQSQLKQTYPFPACMYEGGKLDRYRWEVSVVTNIPEIAASLEPTLQGDVIELPETLATPARQILELPNSKPLTFYLSDLKDADAILKRLRLWVTWSEKAMPQSRWEIVQENSVYMLMNAHFKRRILSFFLQPGAIALENSLPVLVKWFHDLSLAVSQTQTQRQYSDTQLKLAYSLLIDMSLPQKEPLVVLNKLFGIEFSKAALKDNIED